MGLVFTVDYSTLRTRHGNDAQAMTTPHQNLTPRTAFTGLSIKATTEGQGVIVGERDTLGLATVLVKKARHEALAQRVREHLHIELPAGPYRAAAGKIALLGTGPGVWLATQEQGSNALATSLREKIGDLASISDQSDGYAVLRLSGPKVLNTLAKLMPLDLHPRAFAVGTVAATIAAHIGATLWRLNDTADGSAVFEIAIFRSLAADFWQALTESAAEFGLVVTRCSD